MNPWQEKEIKRLEEWYHDLVGELQNVKTTAGATAIRNAMNGVSQQLKRLGHHGFDFNK